jgi:raffinose/stachyose/melibiose transport system permease protein
VGLAADLQMTQHSDALTIRSVRRASFVRLPRVSWTRPPRGTAAPIVLSLLPGLVLFAVFFAIPIGVLVVTSFTDWSLIGWHYIGAHNYRRLIHDWTLWVAARNTAIYAAAGVLVQVPLGCAAGIILSQKLPGWRVYRAILFIPFVISGAAYALVFSMVYNPRYGLLDGLLGWVGLNHHQDWLFDVHTALPAVIGTFVFILGFVMILVMAEIAAIPLELYEAAQVDGATLFQQHRRITLPLLRNVLGTCVLITVLGYLALFDIVYILTAGGPGNGTVTLVLYAYRIYTNGDWGYANAIGTFIVLAGAVLIVGVRRLFRIGERDL